MFQHRHYKFIAAIIADLPKTCTKEEVAEYFACTLKGTDPRFNYDRFFSAATGNPQNGRDK